MANLVPILVLLILALASSLPVLAATKESTENAALARPSIGVSTCSTTILFGSAGTFTVCIDRTIFHVGEPVGITMMVTNTGGGPPPGYILCCTVFLNITNNGTHVFSDSQRTCPTCILAQGQSLTFDFAWIPTKPLGIDNVQGTLFWDFGCRMQGCAIVTPPPGITSVNATVQNPDPDPSGAAAGAKALNT